MGENKIPTPEILHKYRAEITGEMKAVLERDSSPLYQMMRYHLGWIDERGRPTVEGRGKQLRPTLCLSACEALNPLYQLALPAAAAVELVHNFSLIHDDIQDDDRERHHRPTVWAIWGKAQAINAGTAMRVLADQALFRLSDQGISTQKLLKASQLLDIRTLQLIEGQYLDLSFENRLDVGIGDYLKMVEGKTSALIACSLELGALLGCEQEWIVQSFYNLGISLGLAFQITDDLLGIWGSPDAMGKSNSNDIHRKKKSFPIVYALDRATGNQRTELEQIYRQEAIDDCAAGKVLEILEDIGARQHTRQAADEYIRHARQKLDTIPLSEQGRQSLVEVMDFMVQRVY